MGWVKRRIVGYIVSATVAGLLASYAISKGYLSAEPTLANAGWLLILGFAFLISLAVTTRMKRRDASRKAWEENQRAWQEYYARMGYSRQR